MKIFIIFIFFVLLFTPPIYLADAATEKKLASVGYNPYRDLKGPSGIIPTVDQIDKDMYNLQFMSESIRLFGIPPQIELILTQAQENQLDVHLSLYVDRDSSRVLADIEKFKNFSDRFDNIKSVIIEKSKRDSELPLSDVISYLDLLREEIPDIELSFAAGVTVWLENQFLAEKVDYILLQSFPYWEGLSADDSLKSVIENRQRLVNEFSPLPVVLETDGHLMAKYSIVQHQASEIKQNT